MKKIGCVLLCAMFAVSPVFGQSSVTRFKEAISIMDNDGTRNEAIFLGFDQLTTYRKIYNTTTGISLGDASGGVVTSNFNILDTGNINVPVGDFDVTAGDLTVTAGNVDVVAGTLDVASDLTVDTGDVTVTGGNVDIVAGTLDVASDVTVDTGDVTVTGGNVDIVAGTLDVEGTVTVDTGNVVISTGDLTVAGTANLNGGVAITGNITGVTDITASGTIQGGTLTDGTLSSTAGTVTGGVSITSTTFTDGTATLTGGDITGAGTVTATTLTDGTASMSAGAVSGVTTIVTTSTITSGGGTLLPIRSESSTVTATTADHTILCDVTGGGFDVDLPAAAGATGLILRVTKTDAGANNVTIDPDGAETINGAASLAFNTQWQTKVIQCDGTSWYTVGGN